MILIYLFLHRILSTAIESKVIFTKSKTTSILDGSFNDIQDQIYNSHSIGICNIEKWGDSLKIDIVQDTVLREDDIQESILQSSIYNDIKSSDNSSHYDLKYAWSS